MSKTRKNLRDYSNDFIEYRNMPASVEKKIKSMKKLGYFGMIYSPLAPFIILNLGVSNPRDVLTEFGSLFIVMCVPLVILLLVNRSEYFKRPENHVLRARAVQHISWLQISGILSWSLIALYFSEIENRDLNAYSWMIVSLIVTSLFVLNPWEILTFNSLSLTGLFLQVFLRGYSFANNSVVYNIVFFALIDSYLMFTRYFSEVDEMRAAKKVIEMKDEREQFMVNMTHEMRTPLNAVLGKNQNIYNDTKEEDTKELSKEIMASGKILMSLINDILDLSKMQAGKMNISPAEYSSYNISYELEDIMRSEAQAKGLGFKIEVSHMLPAVLFGDDVRIRQVIMNLLSNAIKYTKDGSVSLRIGFTYEDKVKKTGILRVAVIDTGIGIKPEDIPKLTQAFSRVDEKNNRNIKGTGLGLAITSSLLELMGSKLIIESEYGLGSTFSFSIEQGVVDETSLRSLDMKKEREKKTASFQAPKARVLVVDDNKVNYSVAKGLTKYYGFVPDYASSGLECIEHLKEKTYDAVFVDHLMPDMDGIETLKKIRETMPEVYACTSFVILSGNDPEQFKEQYAEAGFCDYLTKPMDVEKMDRVLRKILLKEE